jgi:hypothetical protein
MSADASGAGSGVPSASESTDASAAAEARLEHVVGREATRISSEAGGRAARAAHARQGARRDALARRLRAHLDHGDARHRRRGRDRVLDRARGDIQQLRGVGRSSSRCGRREREQSERCL